MRTQSTFNDWDFTDTWTFESGKNGGYPILQNVAATSDLPLGSANTTTSMSSSEFTAKFTSLSADYLLLGDITLTDAGYVPIGHNIESGPGAVFFIGTLDGNNKKINNIKFGTVDNSGMFKCISKAGFVRNLHLRSIAIGTISTWEIGSLASENAGVIYQCSVTGEVAGHTAVGGLVGYNYGIISECYSTAVVTGRYVVGGLVGHNRPAASILNSYARGKVKSIINDESVFIGGLIGSHGDFASVINSYSTGVIEFGSGQTEVGGFIGKIGNDCTVTSCFYDSDSSGQNDENTGFCKKSTADMQTIHIFNSGQWNITGSESPDFIWGINEGIGYPYLQWE